VWVSVGGELTRITERTVPATIKLLTKPSVNEQATDRESKPEPRHCIAPLPKQLTPSPVSLPTLLPEIKTQTLPATDDVLRLPAVHQALAERRTP
jgi:hypothetical protein